MRAGAIRPSLQGPDASEGGNSRGAELPREVLVWALAALTQAFRIPFDEKFLAGQMPPPYEVNSMLRSNARVNCVQSIAERCRRATTIRQCICAGRNLNLLFLRQKRFLFSNFLRIVRYGRYGEPLIEPIAKAPQAASRASGFDSGYAYQHKVHELARYRA